ncbi:hypothetical protein KDH_31200 [Dictyobacter sp. S3.2.2.5]|uniref:Uncharacterized protein n=1 Tax=Dictyobacter halimunensis TaxID=3026934 RepID=A0ABQ6FUW8_9CHLR|nr:hypothetical protein KDH_31200 [Dictyobacter sp. S3.2.2.5]
MIKPGARVNIRKHPIRHSYTAERMTLVHIITFSHPDYTVGFGLSPNLFAIDQEAINGKLAGSAQLYTLCHTAGREFHPAPKVLFVVIMPYTSRNMQVLKLAG